MTHYYQFSKSLPYSRRKLNSAFVHALKKLCGIKHHLHVLEYLDNDDFGAFVSVNYPLDSEAKNEIIALCKRYGIGSDYIETYEDVGDETKEYINIYLEKPCPYTD